MSIDRRIWNIACDIAVFAMINDIFPNVIPDGRDYWNLKYTFDDIKNNVGVLTAEKIYYYLKNCGEYEDIDDLQSLNEKFEVDSHIFWYHDGQEQSENSDNTFDTPHISGQSNITAAQMQSVSECFSAHRRRFH